LRSGRKGAQVEVIRARLATRLEAGADGARSGRQRGPGTAGS